MRPSIVASLLLLASCSAPPASQPTVTLPTGAPAAPEAPLGVGPEALVWTETKDHPPTTRWIAPTASGYRRIAEAPGLLLASGPDVWRWSAHEVPVKTEGCDGKPPGKGSVTQVFLEKVGGSDRVEIVPPKKIDRVEYTIDHSATPVGSLGPYLFVRERTDLDPCAAHHSVEVEQSVWDVSRRSRVELLTPEERKGVDTSEHATALRLFSEQAAKLGLPQETVSYVASVPRYQARGFLSVEHLFITHVSHAGSDGVWSSSTKSVQIPASQLPAKAQPYVQPPPAVTAYVADHPGETISGWSTVSKDAAAVLGSALGAH